MVCVKSARTSFARFSSQSAFSRRTTMPSRVALAELAVVGVHPVAQLVQRDSPAYRRGTKS